MKMIKYVPLFFILPIFIGASMANKREPIQRIELETKPITPVLVEEVKITPSEKFLEALIYVESKGNDSAIGDRHLGSQYAVGVLQIRPIMVREVNRILKLKGDEHQFQLKDRYDREKSIQMFLIWKEFHHKDSDYEEIARSWNGGPNGMKKPRTYSYWKKVEKQLAGL